MTAKAVAAKPVKPEKPAKSPRRSGWLVLVLTSVLAAAFLPIAAVIFCGMLPTAVAWLTDRDPRKHSVVTVGTLNFCGVAPFVMAVWQKGHSIDTALAMLAHPITWLVMLGGAALGWMIYFSVPPAVTAIVVRRTQSKAAALEERKKKLAELWDPPLSGAASPKTAAPGKAK